jgi:hypothetical protein
MLENALITQSYDHLIHIKTIDMLIKSLGESINVNYKMVFALKLIKRQRSFKFLGNKNESW